MQSPERRRLRFLTEHLSGELAQVKVVGMSRFDLVGEPRQRLPLVELRIVVQAVDGARQVAQLSSDTLQHESVRSRHVCEVLSAGRPEEI